MNKIFKSALVAVVATVGLTMTSCVNEYNYDAASASGEQVYFGSDMANTIETPKSANSFSVMVRRINTAGSLTVPVTITQSDGSIYVPSAQQVTFADGATEAPLTFNYNPEDVVYGTYYDITVKLNDESQASAYGLSSYSFKAGATAWVNMQGKATYIEDFVGIFFGVENITYQTSIQRNTVEEGMYRLVNPYGKAYPYNEDGDYDTSRDYYLTVNATDPNYVYVETSPTGMNWSYGAFTMTSVPGYLLDNGMTLDQIKAKYSGYFGKMKDGIITMPAGSLMTSLADYNGGKFSQGGKGMFTIALPGYVIADLSASLEYAGIFTDASNKVYAVGNLALGADAENVKAVVMPADADADAVADAIAAGELEAIDVVAGSIQVPIPEDMTGKLQIIVVVLNDDNEVKTVSTAKFEYYGGVSPWKSIGIGYYTDDVLYSTFTKAGDPLTYEVEIEESTETPGLYRLKSVYSIFADWWGEGSGEADIIVHAENPNAVFLYEQSIGLTYDGADMTLVTYGGDALAYYESQGVAAETVINARPQWFGKVTDGVITFPSFEAKDSDGNPITYDDGTPLTYQGWLSAAEIEKAWYIGTNGAMQIVLPGASVDEVARAKRVAAASNFARRLNVSAHKGVKESKRQLRMQHFLVDKVTK